jgi:hypothetical protein
MVAIGFSYVSVQKVHAIEIATGKRMKLDP